MPSDLNWLFGGSLFMTLVGFVYAIMMILLPFLVFFMWTELKRIRQLVEIENHRKQRESRRSTNNDKQETASSYNLMYGNDEKFKRK